MTTGSPRTPLRSLPALIALLIALILTPFVAPAATSFPAAALPAGSAASALAGVSADAPAAGVTASPDTAAALAHPEADSSGSVVAPLGDLVADRTRTLPAQRAAGSTGSRAPPASL